MDIYVMCKPEGLVPLYDSDYENKCRLKTGAVYRLSVSLPRNYKFHKKFFALLRLAADNIPDRFGIRTVDDMLLALKYELGMVEIINLSGREFVKPKSISFAEMDEGTFEKFFSGCVRVILNKFLAGTDEDDLIEELERYL